MKKQEHESYGMLSINRVHGNPGNLFGSTASQLHNFISLSIRQGSLEYNERGESEHYAHGSSIIEVFLSPIQLTKLLTSIGYEPMGVPCTIKRLQGSQVGDPPDEVHPVTARKEALLQKTLTMVGNFRDRAGKIHELLNSTKAITKAQRELIGELLQSLRTDLEANLPHMFDGYLDAVEDSKVEESFTQGLADKVGYECANCGPVDDGNNGVWGYVGRLAFCPTCVAQLNATTMPGDLEEISLCANCLMPLVTPSEGNIGGLKFCSKCLVGCGAFKAKKASVREDYTTSFSHTNPPPTTLPPSPHPLSFRCDGCRKMCSGLSRRAEGYRFCMECGKDDAWNQGAACKFCNRAMPGPAHKQRVCVRCIDNIGVPTRR